MLLATVPERVSDLVAGLDEARLRHRHAPAFPTLHELIVHVTETGIAVDALLRHAYLDGESEVDLRVAIDPPLEPRPALPVDDLLDSFARVRRRTVDLLRGLTDADWARGLKDPVRGESSLLEVGRLVTTHELGHLAQIRNLTALLPEPQDLGPVGGPGPRTGQP